jgi:peptidoglycan/LPS O-acetylase OafA/YrhL
VKLGAYSHLQARIRLPSIPALDGIRAIAVFLVVFYHLSNERPLPVFPGPLGVLGFFVLSGFLITWLLLKEKEKSGSISLKGFYRRRLLRIFPAFYVFWIIAVGSRWMAHGGNSTL